MGSPRSYAASRNRPGRLAGSPRRRHLDRPRLRGDLLGGIRSLLLQALHPLALAGVDRHSSYRDDPFGRLQNTGAFIAATTYGSADLAQSTVAAIGRMHDRVQGSLSDGRTYSARDPRLLEWVHVALVDSMLTAYLEFGHNGPISADGYVADMAVVGAAMGVVDPPRSHGELTARIDGFRPELSGGAGARQMRDFIMSAPCPGAAAGIRRAGAAARTRCPTGPFICSATSRRAPARRARAVVPTRRCGRCHSHWFGPRRKPRGTPVGRCWVGGRSVTVLLGILAAAAVVVGLVALLGFIMSRTVVRGNAQKAAVALGPMGPGDGTRAPPSWLRSGPSAPCASPLTPVRFAAGVGRSSPSTRRDRRHRVPYETGSGGRLKRPCLPLAAPTPALPGRLPSPTPTRWVRRLT